MFEGDRLRLNGYGYDGRLRLHVGRKCHTHKISQIGDFDTIKI